MAGSLVGGGGRVGREAPRSSSVSALALQAYPDSHPCQTGLSGVGLPERFSHAPIQEQRSVPSSISGQLQPVAGSTGDVGKAPESTQ